jgi:hypothetical protein
MKMLPMSSRVDRTAKPKPKAKTKTWLIKTPLNTNIGKQKSTSAHLHRPPIVARSHTVRIALLSLSLQQRSQTDNHTKRF